MGQGPAKSVRGAKFRVIGAGMTRTDTKSFREALEILLDGPVHDGATEGVSGPWRHRKEWLEAMELAPRARTISEQKRLDWLLADLHEGYVGTTDIPGLRLAPELLRVFPDAIVIATKREPESWWKSQRFIDSYAQTWWLSYFLAPVPRIGVYPVFMKLRRRLLMWRFGIDELTGPGSLKAHEDLLRQTIPPEKLFLYDVRDGWEPLCNILGVSVPDRPFPHKNHHGEVKAVFRLIVLMGFVSWVAVILLGGGALCLLVRLWSHWQTHLLQMKEL
ncbi:hypothetical protein NW754_001539 [Fusarium falciforme]|nr:hypothetical protein NW754_001539 [Fusarium falciforme]